MSAPVRSAHGIDTAALSSTLCDLGRVERVEDLGTNGPLLASSGAHSLFHCLFGRDSLRMAMDLLDDFPAVARTTLIELARLQGVDHNPRADEEPGRILHEYRHPDDPHAIRLADNWDFPYFGTVDATPQWIILLGEYCDRHGSEFLDEGVTDRAWRNITLRDALLAAVAWIVGRLDDPSGGGFLWVRRASGGGIPNQVWEDSIDSHYHADGDLFDFDRPYVPIAVQGYAYDALLVAADLLERSPDSLRFEPIWLRSRADGLRQRIVEHLWQPDLETFAQALTVEPNGSLRPARVVASSAGHLLSSRLLDGHAMTPIRALLARRLGRADMLAGGGIRTKSTEAPRFRAGSYHNGSTWPMDSGVIADGLRRHGFARQASDIEERVLRGCGQVGGFPEFLRGDLDGSISENLATVDDIVDGVPNRLEQPPQANQGWTATRVWRILRRRGLISPSGTVSATRDRGSMPGSHRAWKATSAETKPCG